MNLVVLSGLQADMPGPGWKLSPVGDGLGKLMPHTGLCGRTGTRACDRISVSLDSESLLWNQVTVWPGTGTLSSQSWFPTCGVELGPWHESKVHGSRLPVLGHTRPRQLCFPLVVSTSVCSLRQAAGNTRSRGQPELPRASCHRPSRLVWQGRWPSLVLQDGVQAQMFRWKDRSTRLFIPKRVPRGHSTAGRTLPSGRTGSNQDCFLRCGFYTRAMWYKSVGLPQRDR